LKDYVVISGAKYIYIYLFIYLFIYIFALGTTFLKVIE